ncbi:MAG: DNA metabolism protein [Sphingobacteriales bacterium]|nr:MAG: DNA metabolism protein [Sphingobacteriales bacterium]
MKYIFDGTMAGLLTAVFEWFERKPGKVQLVHTSIFQPDAFSHSFTVVTDNEKADRVWKGMVNRLDKIWQRRFYCCYLSEQPAALSNLFSFACYIFQNGKGAEDDYGRQDILDISKTAHSVEREKHRMEAFIRFEKTADGIFYAGIDPDFNVLPLIVRHFKDRYADQKWVIYDLKRKYGLFYDLADVSEITVSDSSQFKSKPANTLLDENEGLYQELWKDYFKSTNIASRKNTKLHIRHVPKRYWKYLTEKQL